MRRSNSGPEVGPDTASQGQKLLSGLQERVRKRLLRMGDELETKAMISWVSFKSRDVRRVFAEVRAHRKDIEAFILPLVESPGEADGVALPAPPTQGWGWFRSKLRITREEELAVATDLLLLSYTVRREMNRKGSRGGWAART